jgi:Tol biopolymer transport system component
MRARLSRVEPEEVLPIDAFADEGPTPLPAALPPLTAPKTAPRYRSALAAAAALFLAIAAGYATYRVRTPQQTTAAATTATPVLESAAAEVSPRTVSVDAHALNLPIDGGVFSPSFASNGTALVFHAGHNTSGRLFQASLDDRGRTSAITPLLENRGRTYHARPAPDGQWIAFDSDRDGERGVYVASRDGAKVARVSGDGFAAVPSWSPDMKWLAFVRGEESRPKVWNLWLRDVSTGSMTRLSAFRSGQVWGASWFPDSRSLCYSHEDRLIVADVDSGSARTFETPIKGRLIRTPAVSPDGKRIVFQVYRDGAWLLDVANGQMRRVLADPTAEEFAWEPGGKAVAYHSRRDDQWRIWLLTI